MEKKLRPLVGLKSWDYCVLWKLGEDQRSLEWVACCCGGAEDNDHMKYSTQNGRGEELPMFPVSPVGPCRDLMFQHPRTINCDLLAHLPSSIPLNSAGAHAQSLISNQPRWINTIPNCSSDDSSGFSEETFGTRVLIPVPGGLIEFFVAKHVSEDPHIIEFVMAQCNLSSWEQQQDAMIMNIRMNSIDDDGGFQVDDNGLTIANPQPPPLKHQQQYYSNKSTQALAPSNITNHFHTSTWVSSSPSNSNANTTTTATTTTATMTDVNFNLPWDLSVDRIRLCSSTSSSPPPMNLFGGGSEAGKQHLDSDTVVVDPSIVSDDQKRHNDDDHDLPRRPPTSTNISGYADFVSLQESLMSDAANLQYSSNIEYSSMTTTTTKLQEDPAGSAAAGQDRDRDRDRDRDSGNYKQGAAAETAGGRADSVSGCSTDQMIEDDDDDDQTKVMLGAGRSSSSSGRPNQSKNLFAERKRRKKLSERLYKLRALVPNISKMDRASILGDAIEFVKELQKQVKDLQDELEEPAGDQENSGGGDHSCRNVNNKKQMMCLQLDHQMLNLHHQNGITSRTVDDHSHPSPSATTNSRCSSSINVQVEVTQIDRNEFFLKVFCEHKPGGFVRLMEAMNSLGLEVTNANVTTFRGLVLNVFKVEQKRDDEMVQADHVRDSLLELTRDRTGAGWSSSEPAVVLDHQAPKT
ncbi:Myc-type [Macleaya cordata]|uniref:Myc-type n=1 Tax=Macleaya cordata TaxID=56857 RepID=A0A200RAT5_MACCD|nr:Myc-type [Macleaya cordata]